MPAWAWHRTYVASTELSARLGCLAAVRGMTDQHGNTTLGHGKKSLTKALLEKSNLGTENTCYIYSKYPHV